MSKDTKYVLGGFVESCMSALCESFSAGMKNIDKQRLFFEHLFLARRRFYNNKKSSRNEEEAGVKGIPLLSI